MRLRKLLQVEGAVRLAEGRLWLDPRLVWCDVAAFEHDCDALLRLLDAPGQDAALGAAARRLRRRASARLFGPAGIEAWSVVPRERLARKFAAALTRYAARLEAQQAWIAAISLYEQGLADDMFAEAFHRGLMRCHLALDQPAAAVRCYHRCRDVLASVLKVRPSAETLALALSMPQLRSELAS
jgi:DNA-binding SARP family transcriptional activator